jgi:four helix bundle protein
MKDNIVKNKSFDFALKIIKLYQFLISQKKEFVLSKQILRSGTSIGALVRESEHEESSADFIHKLSISLKEANETPYWLELLHKSKIISDEVQNEISKEIDEIIRILASIIKTTKSKK